MPKVSIIMPSLNVAPYIRECIESVICQTLKDIEILCVDAGSTDGTWEILEEYAKNDERIRMIKSGKKSYGYQMNLGIREASGEYIGIVETDDFILPHMYETLYGYAEENDAEVVKSDFDVFTTLEDGERIFLNYSLRKHGGVTYYTVFTSNDYMNRRQTMDVFIWNGIYKRKFLQDHHIFFQETPGAAFQDCGFRYQVALHLQRGFFLQGSFYRYRRDNVNSSTYNKKCVLFNLAECRNLIRIVQEMSGEYSEQMSFLAKEITVIAHSPYIELLTWGQPAEETKEALAEFRTILQSFIEKEILNPASVTEDAWLEIRMFVENPDFYDYYVHLRAEIAAETIRGFLADIAKQEQVILFGSGYVGACAYCLIRNNGIDNIVAFCDNDETKWGSSYHGRVIVSPEEAVRRFPGAFFLITNAGHADELQRQLTMLGVEKKRMKIYMYTTSPMECTNMVMRQSETKGLLQ